jgi:hypothetical protein
MMEDRSTSALPIDFPLPPLSEGARYPLDLDIYYVLTIPDGAPEDASPLQGFAPSLCRHHGLVRAATLLPSTIYDLTKSGQETLLVRRMSGSNPVNWHGQTPRALRLFRVPPMVPFNVIMINPEEDADNYKDWAASCVVPPVLVAKNGGEITFDELSAEKLRELFLARCDLLPGTIDPDDIATAKHMLSSWVETPCRKLGYQVGGHNSVTPNVLALTSAGYVDLVYGPFKDIMKGTKPYVDQIVRTTNSILDERRAVGDRDIHRMFRPTMDVSLFAPSLYPHFLKMPIPRGLDHSERRRFEQVCQALRRQEGYAFDIKSPRQFQAVFGIDKDAAKTDGVKPKPHPLMVVRAEELGLATEAMGALAVSELSAVVRLPNDVNRSAGLVRSFAQQYRGNAPSSRKRLLAFREVQRRLAEAVPPALIDVIRRSETGLRIVADAHLEWLDIDGIPLALRKNVCRIPTTPGNLFIDLVGPHEHIRLTPADLTHVLIIGALKRNDPIRKMFEIAFDTFGKVWKDKMRIDFVDVASEEEFVAAIDKFEGNIVVFDGHGAHEEDSAAALYLQDEPIDVWSLRGKVRRMPPIVILSACDTHAADRNHATVANGFVALGARAVLASVFPLFAPTAATFAARLIYRLADFLMPAIRLFDRALTWTEVVSGMIRMQLLTDFLRRLELGNQITKETCLDIHLAGNKAINSSMSDPFGIVVDALVDAGLERTTALHELEFSTANSSAISYLHVGRPETILIDDIDRAKEQLALYQVDA